MGCQKVTVSGHCEVRWASAVVSQSYKDVGTTFCVRAVESELLPQSHTNQRIMRLLLLIFGALATCGVHGQTADSKVVYDPITHISYSSYTSSETGITFGVALPMNVSDPYDAIISITAPIANVTWAGFAWAGTMVWNPLTVAWPNGKTTVVSSRFALYEFLGSNWAF
jgi:hypothetical protein